MKRFSNPILKIVGVLALFSLLSCFGEDDGDVETCNYDYELNYYYDMIDVYSNNPTVGTCNDLRDAALDLLDALDGCADYDYYYDATQAWLSLDCSGIDPDPGPGPGPGPDPGSGSGKATFWTQSDLGCGYITVNISGYTGTVSGYYSGGAPSCGAEYCANFTLEPGIYSWTAYCENYTWDGTITVSEDGCSTMQLYL